MVFAENGNGFLAKIEVAPFVGAWIEILYDHVCDVVVVRRSLRGSVD